MGNFRYLSESLWQSMAEASCKKADINPCQDESEAFTLKLIAIASILLASIAGVAIPLVGKHRNVLRTEGSLFVLAKAFAAGVILATGFVHMLDAGSDALSDPCLPEFPWSKFPFSGLFAMLAALMTLLVDFLGTQYYRRKQGLDGATGEQSMVRSLDGNLETRLLATDCKDGTGRAFEEIPDGAMHIVGMHSHGISNEVGDADDSTIRHIVVSQVLELGIVSHSVIIGLSLGVSQSSCTIRPLVAALSFHQFFEGFALGGCISQAQFKPLSATMMACFFSVTTPAGIAVGVAVASFYNPDSPRALLTEGILDSLSAGILIYMALVDLIAAEFLSKKMSFNLRLQLGSFLMLFLGAGLMAALAIWA